MSSFEPPPKGSTEHEGNPPAYPDQGPPGTYPSNPSAPQQPGYPPQQQGYPPQQYGYPPQQQGYPPQQQGYPPPPPGYAAQQPGYPPPPPGYHQPPVTYIQQQPMIMVQGIPAMHRFDIAPVHIVCPSCQADILTETSYVVGGFAWIICAILFGAGFFVLCTFFFCCLPFCIDSCKDVVHRCPNCHATVGRMSRGF